jgi:hypothetical protein
MRVHATPGQSTDPRSIGDQECTSAAVGGLPPGSGLEEMEKHAMRLMSEHIYRINFLHWNAKGSKKSKNKTDEPTDVLTTLRRNHCAKNKPA